MKPTMDFCTQLKFEIIVEECNLTDAFEIWSVRLSHVSSFSFISLFQSQVALNTQKAFAVLNDRMGDEFTSSFTQVTEQIQDMSHCAKLKK